MSRLFFACVDYCEYPGTIKNGQILLVGVTGKFEYRHYISRTSHNEKIEYHCGSESESRLTLWQRIARSGTIAAESFEVEYHFDRECEGSI